MKTDFTIIYPVTFAEEVSDVDVSGLTCSNHNNNFVAKGTITIRLESGKEIVATGEHGTKDYDEFGFILIPACHE